MSVSYESVLDGIRFGQRERRAFGQTDASADGTREKIAGGRAPADAVERSRRGKRCADCASDGSNVDGHVDRDGDERKD